MLFRAKGLPEVEYNSTELKVTVRCAADAFVVNLPLVLRINLG